MHVLSRSGATASDELSMLKETLFGGLAVRLAVPTKPASFMAELR